MPNEPNEQMEALGAAIRAQRKLANLSLRQLAGIAEISNPYLSQIERGLHAPSVHVLRSIANALSLSAETLQQQAGVIGEQIWPGGSKSSRDTVSATELAVRRDASLTDEQKAALLAVYRSYRDANVRSDADETTGGGGPAASTARSSAKRGSAPPRRPRADSGSTRSAGPKRSRPQATKKRGS